VASDVVAADAVAPDDDVAPDAVAPDAGIDAQPDPGRLLPRRTFTIEVRVDGDAESESGQVLATRVVHLETQHAQAWPGWSRARLVDFLETRIGVAGPEHGRPAGEPTAAEDTAAGTESAGAAAALAPPPAAGAGGPPSPALAVHRFGLLKAAAPATGRGETAARLRLVPADLDLPARRSAVAQVELFARPAGPGRAEMLDARVIDLTTGGAVDVVLRGRLPDRDPPFTVFATVRVLVDQPSGRPSEGVGSATLELAPGGGPAA
jgi:hypothetical protein